LRGRRFVERSHLDDFPGDALLGAVLATLEILGLLKDLVEGFFAIRKSNPGVAVPVGTTEPDSKISGHASFLRILIIPVSRLAGGWALGGLASKSKRP